MAHTDVESSNALFEILADWESQLKHSDDLEETLARAAVDADSAVCEPQAPEVLP